MMPVIARNMPKIESPFVREMINGQFIVTPKIAEGMEWVFKDEGVMCLEKTDGTNVSVIIREATVIEIWNREERIPFINKHKNFITEGILNAKERGYLELPDGQWFGELIGKKVNSNPYKLEGHLWIPFETYAKNSLKYKSWGKYPKTYEAISAWFETDLKSLYMMKRGILDQFAEGVVFYHPDGIRMAKLRRDMFSWFKGHRHKEDNQ
jgi:hypothetical protein